MQLHLIYHLFFFFSIINTITNKNSISNLPSNFANYPNKFYMQDSRIRFKHHATTEAGSMFIATCFEIWRNKNKEIYQNVKKDNWASVNDIYSYHSSIVHALGPTNKQHVIRQIH
jgi:uncharacterized membrane protein YjdF